MGKEEPTIGGEEGLLALFMQEQDAPELKERMQSKLAATERYLRQTGLGLDQALSAAGERSATGRAREYAGCPEERSTLLWRRTLRSGQRISCRGNVVVLGDVNPGAEVVARGDILVLGTLRGVAHAGAMGNSRAIVAAFRLQPMQLRIGRLISRSPEGESPPGLPEVARVRSGKVVIEGYLPRGERHGADGSG